MKTTQKAVRIDNVELQRVARVRRLLLKQTGQTKLTEAEVLRTAIKLGLDELLKRLE